MAHWLEAIYRDHAPVLYRFLVRLTGQEAETRDVLQEVFLRLAKAPGCLDDIVAPRSYLFRMAHRLVIDRQRREQTRRLYDECAAWERNLASSPETPASDVIWSERFIAASLAGLPLEQKTVVVLKIWEELTFAEIAEVLEISPNRAASRYGYALDKLRDSLRPLYNDRA